MSKKYPFYPTLSEQGEKEAADRRNDFIDKLRVQINDLLGEFYCSELLYIESDSWSNFRNELMDGFRDYRNNKAHAEFDFKEIRKKIFSEFRDEIINDLNQDLLEENRRLKEQIKRLRNWDNNE